MHSEPKITLSGAMPHGGKRLLTIQEFTAAYGVSRSKYFLLRREGLGPPEIKIGRNVYIHVDDAETWALSFRQRPSKASHAAPESELREESPHA